MRYLKFFDRNFSRLKSALNLCFVGALEPEFDRLFDHRLGMLWGFTLADNAKFGTIGYVPTVFPRFNHRGELWKFHDEEFIQSSNASLALRTASSSVSPAEAHPGNSGKNAAQRLVSGSRSTTSRSFMRQRINAARLPRQIRKCTWRNWRKKKVRSDW